MPQNYHPSAVQRNGNLLPNSAYSEKKSETRSENVPISPFVMRRDVFERALKESWSIETLKVWELLERLSYQTGYCYANNQTIARFLGWESTEASSRRVQRYLSKFESNSLLKRDEGETPRGTKRRLFIADASGNFCSAYRERGVSERHPTMGVSERHGGGCQSVTPKLYPRDLLIHSSIDIKGSTSQNDVSQEVRTFDELSGHCKYTLAIKRNSGALFEAGVLEASDLPHMVEMLRARCEESRSKYPSHKASVVIEEYRKQKEQTRSEQAREQARLQAAKRKEHTRHNYPPPEGVWAADVPAVSSAELVRNMKGLSFGAQELIVSEIKKRKRPSWADSPYYQTQQKIAGGESC